MSKGETMLRFLRLLLSCTVLVLVAVNLFPGYAHGEGSGGLIPFLTIEWGYPVNSLVVLFKVDSGSSGTCEHILSWGGLVIDLLVILFSLLLVRHLAYRSRLTSLNNASGGIPALSYTSIAVSALSIGLLNLVFFALTPLAIWGYDMFFLRGLPIPIVSNDGVIVSTIGPRYVVHANVFMNILGMALLSMGLERLFFRNTSSFANSFDPIPKPNPQP